MSFFDSPLADKFTRPLILDIFRCAAAIPAALVHLLEVRGLLGWLRTQLSFPGWSVAQAASTALLPTSSSSSAMSLPGDPEQNNGTGSRAPPAMTNPVSLSASMLQQRPLLDVLVAVLRALPAVAVEDPVALYAEVQLLVQALVTRLGLFVCLFACFF